MAAIGHTCKQHRGHGARRPPRSYVLRSLRMNIGSTATRQTDHQKHHPLRLIAVGWRYMIGRGLRGPAQPTIYSRQPFSDSLPAKRYWHIPC
jgi:hypothetical protein